jgi:hypothetical protein
MLLGVFRLFISSVYSLSKSDEILDKRKRS